MPATDLQVPFVTAAEVMEGGYQVVDVRSPGEFSEGHMPGAVNRPFLDDAQRAAVGSAYKESGAPRARIVALEQVSPGLFQYLSGLAEFARTEARGRRLAVMCSRGGERSRNVVLLLALIGLHALKVAGGYQSYRREVVKRLAEWRSPMPVITLFGHTGVGKTALLRGLADVAPTLRGLRPWVVDLEGLALHRGSLLGGLNQPEGRRQKDFDALLWGEIRECRGDYLVLEGEGAKIGNVFLPENVAGAIRGGSPVHVSASSQARVERIVREYAPELWTAAERERFRRSLGLIAKRVSRETILSLETAFDDGRFTDVVRGLLVEYYDPLYRKSCVEGRRFILEFETGPDPVQDARRFAQNMARLIREVSPNLRDGYR